MNGFATGYERLARTILMVFVANVAFVAHTLLGLIAAGFFPSIAASAATFRTWVLDDTRTWTIRETWTVFHRAWRAELGPANAFGWPQLAVWLLLIWDYYLANWNDMGLLGVGVSGVLLLVNVLFGVFVMISWVVRANFDERAWWVVRTSLRMVIARPLCTVMTVAVLVITVWAWYTWPGILMTFGFALPALAVVLVVSSFGRLPGMGARERGRPDRHATPQERVA
ncbi:YesL family protein [Microbacterium flavum]|uniref:YesL family protein n=1 Tax=Microbacterium flavum TaxID=415216 RepID=UPI0024AE0A6D|nr:DUF624 domain-containing protein [Microbacterium flavum]